jgi:hypothetical protein
VPKLPPPAGWDETVGIFTGGCVERGDGSSFRAKAHAHTGREDQFRGWVCVRAARRVFMADGVRPSHLLLHERAHLIAAARGSRGHDDIWRAVMRELGARVEARYRKKPRGARR